MVTIATSEIGREVEFNYAVDIERSIINWTGYVQDSDNHTGNIYLSEGALLVYDQHIEMGTFIVDMKSMLTTDGDDNYEDGSREELLNYLESNDVFNILNYPVAVFEIIESRRETMLGILTINGQQVEAMVRDVTVYAKEGELKAQGVLVFNANNFGISFEKEGKKAMAFEEIEMKISLFATLIKEDL